MYRRRADKKFIISVCFIVVPFLCLFIPTTVFSSFKLQIARSIYPLGNILSAPLLELKKILYYHRTFREYLRLRKEVDTLKSRLVGLEEVLRENRRFEQLLLFKRTLIFSSITANVIGRDPTNWGTSLVIDRGTKDGIGEGMPVVSAAGVVGRIAEVAPSASRVILLTDPQFSVAALVQESRETGLVSGTLQGLCRLRYVPPEAPVQIGDHVITSKISTSFPEGIMVGEIVALHPTADKEIKEYVVRPAVFLSRLEEVLVIQR